MKGTRRRSFCILTFTQELSEMRRLSPTRAKNWPIGRGLGR
ncbi:MAG: hypothetical protein QNL35_00715 [Emcibacteraceae bacterium]